MSILIQHKRARHDYEILDTFTAGVALLGTEVKSIRNHQGKLEGAFIKITPDGAILANAYIPPFQQANTSSSYNPARDRALLLTKKELAGLRKELNTKGLTIVPISLYNKGAHIKLDIALVRGKKKYDKREALKARDTKRMQDRLLKERR